MILSGGIAAAQSIEQDSVSIDSTIISSINELQQHQTIIDSILGYGRKYLGTPYRYGSPGVSRFDCSGFTSHVFRNFGIQLNRSSAGQAVQVPRIKKDELLPGDLVFFQGRRINGRVGHVGIVTEAMENGQFRFIHASVQQGVTISHSSEPYYSRRFVSAGRILSPELTLARVNLFPENAGKGADTEAGEDVVAAEVRTVQKTIPAKVHYVKPGETLSHIAHKYGVSVSKLKKQNKLRSDVLQIKQKIVVRPAKTVTETLNEAAL
jgi:LysM repeat protein